MSFCPFLIFVLFRYWAAPAVVFLLIAMFIAWKRSKESSDKNRNSRGDVGFKFQNFVDTHIAPPALKVKYEYGNADGDDNGAEPPYQALELEEDSEGYLLPKGNGQGLYDQTGTSDPNNENYDLVPSSNDEDEDPDTLTYDLAANGEANLDQENAENLEYDLAVDGEANLDQENVENLEYNLAVDGEANIDQETNQGIDAGFSYDKAGTILNESDVNLGTHEEAHDCETVIGSDTEEDNHI